MTAVLGTVVRLQLQRSRLKPGPRGARAYDPAPLLEVDALRVDARGAQGLDGTLDVHHADHPDTRRRRGNGLSLLPAAHYGQLRQAYGDHVADGTAGESLLVEVDGALPEQLLLETADGPPLVLTQVQPAPPCLEFSRWCLGREPGAVDDEVLAALEHLGGGLRGSYAEVRGSGTVVRGARLLRA